MKFRVLKDFYCDELRSHYLAGMLYTVRPLPPASDIPDDAGTPKSETPLGKLLPGWIKDGRAELVDDDAINVRMGSAPAKVSGKGEVT